MNILKTKGLILRSANYGENAKMLTVLTEDSGKISVAAKGASSVRRGAAALSNLCFSEFILHKHGDIYSLSDVSPIENFFGLSKSLDYMECSAKMMKLTDYICHENEPAGNILRTTLNCLFAMSNLKRDHSEVLAVFLFKILCETGYAPELISCSACGNANTLTDFSCEYGGVLCADCSRHCGDSIKISADALSLMQYICNCDIKQIFKFTADANTVLTVQNIAKLFISEHLEYQIQ